jgi:soluble cytochrome b562
MKFQDLIKKSYYLLEQGPEDIAGAGAPPPPNTGAGAPPPDVSGMGNSGAPEEDPEAKKMQEQITKSQERVLDLIKNIVTYLKNASTDKENTKYSLELQKFLKDLDEATLTGTDATACLSSVEKVVNGDEGKELYEPKIAGESFYQQWKGK